MDAAQDDPARHGIGGNNPPEPTKFDALLAEANERVDIANRWLIERPEITDAEMADKAGGFKKQIGDTRKALDAIRADENRAFRAAQEAKYAPILDLLDKAYVVITNKLTAWLKAEQDRQDEIRRAREAEARRQQQEADAARRKAEEAARQVGADALRQQQEAERKQREADAAQKAAAAPVKAAIKGDFTPRAMTLRTTWRARITDAKAALKHYGKHPVVQQAALDAALKLAEAEAKARKGAMPPPGVQFYAEQKAA